MRLVGAGIAIRELGPVVPPLEAAFLALTGADIDAPTPSTRSPPDDRPPSTPPFPVQPVALRRCYRFELVKLVSQWRLRLVFLACLLAPAVYTAVISRQTSLPADAVYGRWMNQSGWAGSLVVLVFTGTLVLPLLTCVVSGDVFAVEDRLGTWRHLLVAVRSPRRIFLARRSPRSR